MILCIGVVELLLLPHCIECIEGNLFIYNEWLLLRGFFKKSASVEKISNGFCCCVLLWCRFWIFWCATAFGVHFLDRLVLC